MNLWEKAVKVALIPVKIVLRMVTLFLPAPRVRIVEDGDTIGYFVVKEGQEKTFFDGTSCNHPECWVGHNH